MPVNRNVLASKYPSEHLTQLARDIGIWTYGQLWELQCAYEREYGGDHSPPTEPQLAFLAQLDYELVSLDKAQTRCRDEQE